MSVSSWRERLTAEQQRELGTAVPGSLVHVLAQMLDDCEVSVTEAGDAVYQLARHPHKGRHGRIKRLEE